MSLHFMNMNVSIMHCNVMEMEQRIIKAKFNAKQVAESFVSTAYTQGDVST